MTLNHYKCIENISISDMFFNEGLEHARHG